MPEKKPYDKPNEAFLHLLIMALRKCEMETGMSLVEYLESLEETDEDMKTDAYDDKSLRKAINRLKRILYPPEQKPQTNLADLAADDAEPEEILASIDDDDDDLPITYKMED